VCILSINELLIIAVKYKSHLQQYSLKKEIFCLRMQSDNRLTQSNDSTLRQCGLGVLKKKTFSSSPPRSQEEAIEWFKRATTHLGLDPTLYNGFEIISKFNSNHFNNIEAAQKAVEIANRELQKFKNKYAINKNFINQ
jgi:hypothetical protein